jgi:recombination associated protein RdgC
MSLRRGSAAFARFALVGDLPKDVRRAFTSCFTKGAFEPVDPRGDDDVSAGFVESEDSDATAFPPGAVFQGDYALAGWKVEKLRVSATQLKSQMTAWQEAFEKREGRKPGRKEKAEAKEAARRALRSKAEPSRKVFDVSVDLKRREAHIWASTRAVVDEVVEALANGLSLKLVPRVPASFVRHDVLDVLSPTPELIGEV